MVLSSEVRLMGGPTSVDMIDSNWIPWVTEKIEEDEEEDIGGG